MDKLRDVETFVAVVEAGSFAGAASATGVTPAMIGRRISQIEKRLGGELLRRSTRRLTLTPAGERYHDHARAMLERLRTAERLASDGRDYATGKLIVSCPSGFGRRHVAPILMEFMRANPDLNISLNLSDRVIDLVRLGYEIGIRMGPVLDPNLVVTRLAPSHMVACASPGYIARHGSPTSPEDVAHHNCLAFNEHGGQLRGWQFRNGHAAISVKPTGTLSSNDGSMLARWAIEGLGIAWRPHWEVAPALANGALVRILEDFTAPDYDIVAAYPQQQPVPAKIRLFIAWLRQVYARPGYWEA